MPYVPLSLPNTDVSAAISMATESHLEQVHYLLAATIPDNSAPRHYGVSAATMTMLAIAATSCIRHFDPRKNKNARRDRQSFTECVLQFFPWDHVTITDDQYRSGTDLKQAATDTLYDVFRNPLVHSGGVASNPQLSGKVSEWYRTSTINHVFPGLETPEDNEQEIEKYCKHNLSGDKLLELEAFRAVIHTRPLYWCTRKFIEAFAADVDVQADIKANMIV